MSFKLEKSIPFIFSSAVLLLVLIGGLTYRSLMNTQDALARETHTREVLFQLGKMQSSLLETETSMRGFVLIGAEPFTQRFEQASLAFRTQIEQLQALTPENELQQERLKTLQNLGEQKITNARHFIDLRRTNDVATVSQSISNMANSSLMEQIRPLIHDLEQAELNELSARQSSLRIGRDATMSMILSGSLLGIFSLAIANLVIVRQLNRRQLAEQALAQANILLEKRVEEQSEDLTKTSDELRQENIRRALAEQQEREQREWWRVTLNSIGDCVITTDTSGTINFMNKMALAVTEWSAEQALGTPLETVFNLIDENTLQPLESPTRKILGDGLIVVPSQQTSLITYSGKRIPIANNGAPIRNDKGEIVGAVLVFRDFSASREAELKLQRAEELQRLALAAGKMGVFAWNVETDALQIDPRVRDLFGIAEHEVLSSAAPLFEVIYPHDRAVVQHHLNAAIEQGKPYDVRFRVQLPEAKMRWLAGVGQIERDAQGKALLLRGINYDITEQVNAEETLRREQQRLRDVIDNLFSFVGVMLPDGTLIEANKTALEAASLRPEDVIGKHFADTYWWSYSPQIQAQLRAAIQRAVHGERVRYDVEVRLGESFLIPIDFMLAPLFDENGNVIYLIPSGLDLSPRREAEKKLRESEEFNRSIFENSPDCVKVLELDGSLHSMNANGLCLMEIGDFSAYAGRDWTQFWQGEYQPLAQAAIKKAAQGKTANFQGFCKTARGTAKWWDVSIAPILNAEGKPLRLIATSRDITENKAQETALRINEIRFRTLTETIPQLVWTCRPDGYCSYLSNRWLAYTGTKLEENVGYGWLQYVHPDDRAKTNEVWQEAVTHATTYQTEFRLRRADGQYRWHLARALKVEDDIGNTVKWFGTCTDIEDHKQAETERIELLEREQILRSKAEEANRLKDDFVATVSHELRTPLNAILGWARMMRAGALDAPTTCKAVEAIERSAENQARLIDDLLDISRITTGKLRLELKPLDPTIVVQEALETVTPTANAKEITLQVHCAPHLSLIAGDASRLQQVVWNLLANAIKFTPRKGRVLVQLAQDQKHVILTIQDNGQGIAPEFLPYVFDRFRQEDATSIRKHGGLGLGLAIVRHLVELHGGTITVASAGENQGATFTAAFPILTQQTVTLNHHTTANALESAREIPTHNGATLLLQGLFILTVEDEPDTRQLLTQLLKTYGATVIAAESAAAALELLRQQKPDVLISDIGLPEMNGYSFIQKVRELEQQSNWRVPAIALTAYARAKDRMQALAAGFNHHVPKPVEPTELITVIASLTGRLQPQDVLSD